MSKPATGAQGCRSSSVWVQPRFPSRLGAWAASPSIPGYSAKHHVRLEHDPVRGAVVEYGLVLFGEERVVLALVYCRLYSRALQLFQVRHHVVKHADRTQFALPEQESVHEYLAKIGEQ